jgi:hypothetical protein
MNITNEKPKKLKIYKLIISNIDDYNDHDIKVKYGLENGEIYDEIEIIEKHFSRESDTK